VQIKALFLKTISKIERSKREVMKNGPPDPILQLFGLYLDYEDFLPYVTSIKQGKKLHLLDLLFLA